MKLYAFAVAAVASILSIAQSSRADIKDLVPKLPGDANCIVVVNVDPLLKSGVAQREAWTQQRESKAAQGAPMRVPIGGKNIVIGGLLDLASKDTVWQAALMEMSRPVSIKGLADSSLSSIETVGGKQAVAQDGSYFIGVDSQVLGSFMPANRQLASRWVGKPQAAVSGYLASAAASVNGNTQIAMALDLEGAISPEQLQENFKDNPINALRGKTITPDDAAKALATIRGITLQIDVGDSANGRMSIDFAGDANAFGDSTKDVMLELLGRSGMWVPDFAMWEVRVDKNSVVAQGPLSTKGLRRLLSVLEVPSTSDAVVASASGEPSAGEPQPAAANLDPEQARVAASQKYFAEVADVIDDLTVGESMSQLAGWLTRGAKKIDKLPILNVDADLLNFGADASAKLNDAARLAYLGNVNANAAAASVATPTINRATRDQYGNYTGGSNSSEVHAQLENARNQKRQLTQQERARAIEAAGQVVNDLKAAKSKVRVEMSQRYKAEF